MGESISLLDVMASTIDSRLGFLRQRNKGGLRGSIIEDALLTPGRSASCGAYNGFSALHTKASYSMPHLEHCYDRKASLCTSGAMMHRPAGYSSSLGNTLSQPSYFTLGPIHDTNAIPNRLWRPPKDLKHIRDRQISLSKRLEERQQRVSCESLPPAGEFKPTRRVHETYLGVFLGGKRM